jgi:hypothetical protein
LQSALQHYQQVPASNRMFLDAVSGMLDAHDELLRLPVSADTGRARSAAIEFAERTEKELAAKPETAPLRLDLQLGRARWLAHPAAPRADLDRALGIVNPVLANPEATAPQRTRARQALLQVLIGLNRKEEARRLLSEQIALDPEELQEAERTLARWARQAPEAARRDLAELQEFTARKLQESRSPKP